MMDRYLCDRLNKLLLDRKAWIDVKSCDISPFGVARVYLIRVFVEPSFDVKYMKRVSTEEFITQTKLWDDIAEEINLVLTFS